jgi:hypothetical protein
MLIMVGVGRPWFPTGDRTARHNRLFIEAVGERAAAIPLGEDARLVVYPAAA